MSEMLNTPSVDVLANRGIGTQVHVVRREGDRWVRAKDGEGNDIKEQYWIKFTNWTLALLEAPAPLGFGSADAWQAAFQNTPLRAMVKTLALLDEKTIITDAGEEAADLLYGAQRLLDGHVTTYASALVNAYMLAQGVSPEKIMAALKKTEREFNEKMNEELNFNDSPQNDEGESSNTQTDQGESQS